MNTHADKIQENKSQSVAGGLSQMQSGSESIFQFIDKRPEAIAQRKLQEMANNSRHAKQAKKLQAMVANNSVQQEQPIQKKENNTGLPDNLKTGMENLSGMSLDDVKVHRNSDKPAQLQAHAYAQGTDIHLGPGQEKHKPHEAWHVVQQKQGRVKPTMQMKDRVNINDDAGLKKEADLMGAKAAQNIAKGPSQAGSIQFRKSSFVSKPVQMVHPAFNEINFWRPQIQDIETGKYEDHPQSPDGQLKRLTGIFGAQIAHELLYTEAEMEDALPREKIIQDYLDNGNNIGRKKSDVMLICLKAEPSDNDALSVMLKKALDFYIAKVGETDISETLDRSIAAGKKDPSCFIQSMRSTYSPPGDLVSAMPKRAPKKGKVLNNAKRYQMPLTIRDPSQNQVEQDIAKGEILSVKDSFIGIQGLKNQHQVKTRSAAGVVDISPNWYVLASDIEVSADPDTKDFQAVPFYKNGVPTLGDIVQQKLGDCYVLAAAGSILSSSPSKITGMFKNIDSEDVAVRFYKRNVKEKEVYFTPEWVQVNKTMYVDAVSKKSLYAKSELVLWPAILEKAYAVWKGRGGGYDPIDEGGHMHKVYEHILGKESEHETVFEHPFEASEDSSLLKDLIGDDVERANFVKYLTDNNVSSDLSKLTELDKIEAVINTSGINELYRQRLNTYLKMGISNKLESIVSNDDKYSTRSLILYDKIHQWLEDGKAVSAGTKAWGSGGTGRSGGENTDSVSGLASTHAYMVLKTKVADNGRKFIRIRNPWGEFGRGYRKDYGISAYKGKEEAAPELPADKGAHGKEIDSGEFWLELSDLTKYFSEVYQG